MWYIYVNVIFNIKSEIVLKLKSNNNNNNNNNNNIKLGLIHLIVYINTLQLYRIQVHESADIIMDYNM